MRDMLKPTLSLLIICLVMTFCLAFVYSITKDTIVQRAEKDAEEQRRLVLSEADSFKKLEGWESEDQSGLVSQVYVAYRDEELVGYVFNASPKGYGGEMAVTVGVSNKNEITGVQIGNNQETPGLGSKTADEAFTVQYVGKDISSSLKVTRLPARADNEIEAVSGATVSSNAVTKAVKASAELGEKLLDGGGVK